MPLILCVVNHCVVGGFGGSVWVVGGTYYIRWNVITIVLVKGSEVIHRTGINQYNILKYEYIN